MTHPTLSIVDSITQKEKDSLDAIARECPEMIQAAWDLCTLVGNTPAQYYIAKHHAKHMPEHLHDYLRKLVLFSEVLSGENPPTGKDFTGITLDMFTDSLLLGPKKAGVTREVATQVACLQLGLPLDTKPVSIDDWVAENNVQGTVVPVGAEAEEAAKAGGLNIASLVPGNDTRH